MNRSKREERRAVWRGILAEQADSGLSAAAFCRERSIPQWKFFSWKKRLAAKKELSASPPPAFQEVRVSPGEETATPAELVFPSGLVLRIPPGFDDARLRLLIETIGAARC